MLAENPCSNKRFSLLRDRAHEDIPALIRLKREGPYWDFKRQWHEQNHELMHDIICLANNLENEVSYLIVGIDEEDDYNVRDVSGDPKRKSSQNLVDLLSKQHWGSPQAPFVLVESIRFDDGAIDAVVIQSKREDMPYYLGKPNGMLRAWMVHTRRVDSNTPIDVGANWSEVEQIWRHHFALDASALDQAALMLRDKANWDFLTSITNGEDKYYRFAPEYTIRHRPDDDRDGYEYYMLNQMDCSPIWYSISLCYHQTTLYDTLGIALDGGRYFAPVPTWSFIRWAGEAYKRDVDVSYCYYTLDSIDWTINEFFFDEEHGDSRIARDRFLEMVILFEDKNERADFERVLTWRKDEFEKRLATQPAPYGLERLPDAYAERGRAMLESQMRAVPVIKSMLVDYRCGRLSSIKTSREW